MIVGDKFVKDGEVVEVIATGKWMDEDIIWYAKKGTKAHLLTKYDFLEQYKPYEIVYEYKWAFINKIDGFVGIDKYFYANENEFYSAYRKENIVGQRLDFTKRERVQ